MNSFSRRKENILLILRSISSSTNGIDRMRLSLQLGQDFLQILSSESFFKNQEIQAEVKLIEKSYFDPARIKQYWLDWLRGHEPLETEDNSFSKFLQANLHKQIPLWIVAEEDSSLKKVNEVLLPHLLSEHNTIFSNENYESIALQCKRGILNPQTPQLVLWIDSDSEGKSVLLA